MKKNTFVDKREVNFELLRIICILMVIILHFLTNSNLKEYMNFNTTNGVIYIFLKSLCYMADNLFVLISGYFLVKSSFKIRKIVDLWIQVFFYSAIIYLMLVILGMTEFSLKTTYFSVFPVYSKQYWFFSCYLMLYLVFPLINGIIESVDRKKHRIMLIVGFIMFSVLESITLISKDPFLLGNGKSLTWFIYLYMVGAYIRLYGNELSDKSKRSLLVAMFLILITTMSYYVLGFLIVKVGVPHIEADKFIALISITIFPASVLVFLAFKKIKLHNELIGKILVFLSPLTFGIYLIHDHNNFRVVLWEMIRPEQYVDSLFLWVYLMIMVPLIYVGCGLIEYLRMKIFLIMKIDQIGVKIENFINRVFVR